MPQYVKPFSKYFFGVVVLLWGLFAVGIMISWAGLFVKHFLIFFQIIFYASDFTAFLHNLQYRTVPPLTFLLSFAIMVYIYSI